ncbi:alpha/beta fold hydrolase [Umezawaea sp. Da 62-37]|uniref:esterase/lipase family protein n=1 Tax=Umezawaea sp. Da 62-37 TaxID=3075927 RepID=UPI0028F6EFF4|nr:alpha/beta fold hydrolase [Umezawaea sp. Da 62-37]WNV84887.1 alpha/beta fold hydrolase [Umezawaea sp. Da 62-37]
MLLIAVGPTPVVIAEAEECESPQTVVVPKGGWSAARRPVVLVHGWIGGPMTTVAHNLEGTRIGDEISTFTFDYGRLSAHWVSDIGIAACLAAYVNTVSKQYGSAGAGGDGKVVVVAHSMGGLAVRYATDPILVTDPVKAGVLAHIVMIGTPHLGSPLGGTPLAWALEQKFLLDDRTHVAPLPAMSAARCLAPHDKGAALPAGCDLRPPYLPPYLPTGVPLTQVAGDVTVDRKLFGHTLYSVPLFTDGSVPVISAHGYQTSGERGVEPANQSERQYRTDACRIDFDLLTPATIGVGVGTTVLFDYLTLAAVKLGVPTPEVLALWLAAGVFATCGHNNLPADPPVLELIADAVESVPVADPHEVRFDGIGAYTLALTGKDLLAEGFVDRGNLYGGSACVSYVKDGQAIRFSVEPATGRVLAIKAGGDRALHTRIGGIHVGSTLAEVRAAFRGSTFDERFAFDFGQRTNGVVVTGPGGSIAFGLTDAPAADYASGRVAVNYLAGVGLTGYAPTNSESGC